MLSERIEEGEKGIEQGIKQGILLGKQKEREQLIFSIFQSGIDTDMIAKIIGCSQEDILSIIEKSS